MFNTSHLIEYMANLPSLQVPTTLLQSALNESLRLARTDSGMIVFFDYEEGREAGAEVHLLRHYLANQAATVTIKSEPGRRRSEENPLSIWLPKGPSIGEMVGADKSVRRVLILPLADPNDGLAIGVVLLLLPRTVASTTISTSDLSNLTLFTRATVNAWLSLRSLINMSRRLEGLVLLNDIATAITQNRDLPDLLQQIMDKTAQLLRASACTLMLLDPATNELVFRVPSGEAGATLKEFRLDITQGISGYVARTGEPVIVNDVRRDPRFANSVDQTTGFQTQAIICAPMVVRGKLIGVIEVLNKEDNSFFNPNDLALLLTLAAQSAISIENAQLYADLKNERDKLIDKEEQVRQDLARDLHDGPAQVFSSIANRAEFIRRLYQSGLEPERVQTEMVGLENIAKQAAKDIRTTLFGLRPLTLETEGLVPTLESYVEKLQSEPWKTHLNVSGFEQMDTNELLRLPHNVEATVFIIVQEAINNIRKHAEPQNVWISLSYNEDETTVMVRDDGRGFDTSKLKMSYNERGSYGMLNMQERSRLINATFDIISKPGGGTRVVVIIHNNTLPRVNTRSLLVTSSD